MSSAPALGRQSAAFDSGEAWTRCSIPGNLRHMGRADAFTESVLDAVRRAWPDGLCLGQVEELLGGQESRVIRAGGEVVRVGPSWRTSAEAEWCYTLAERLSASCSGVVPPIRNLSAHTTIRVKDHPVSVWPWIDATPGAREERRHRHEAAAVLARLHIGAVALDLQPRPPMSAPIPPIASLADRQLDAWLSEFERSHSRHALHGDYYPGNLLFEGAHIIGVVDWDEAVVDAPEVELAVAAAEWGDLLRTGDLSEAVEFVDVYCDNGGTAERIEAEVIAQLYRQRLRWEIAYEEHHGGPLDSLDDEDRVYRLRQIALYHDLRVR